MRKLIIWTGLILPSFVLLVSFQNCSKIQTEDLLADQVGKLTASEVDTADLPTGPTVIDQEGKRTLPVPLPPADPLPPVVKDPPVIEDPQVVKDPPGLPLPPSPPLCQDQDDEGNVVIGHCNDQPGQPPKMPPVVEGEEKDDPELNEARIHCKIARESGWARKIISKIFRIEEIIEDKSFDRLNGRYIFLSGPNRAKILNINSSKGLKVFCDLEIDRIEDSDGRIILINSFVRELNKHNGRLDLINSRVEKIEKSSGDVQKHEK